MAHQYNAPPGSPSTIGPQSITSFHIKKSLVDARRKQVFSQLSSTRSMPKNYGKKITIFTYVPLLDDRNVNDQGIDAAGATITNAYGAVFSEDDRVRTFAVEADATAATNAVNAVEAGVAVKTGSATPWTVTLGKLTISGGTAAEAAAVQAAYPEAHITAATGNLYGSSKDVGYITTKLPVLGENGGRVNRVGFTRLQREAELEKMGFFTEFTQDSLDFDSDPEVLQHISDELLNGAFEVDEDLTQMDLLNGAGVVQYAGDATTDSEMQGNTLATANVATYDDLTRLSIILDNNRTPKTTKAITGSRMQDTRTIGTGRPMFIGSELLPLVRKMKDPFDEKAFIEVYKYADAGSVLEGEVGNIADFRVVVADEMMHWEGVGAADTANKGFLSDGDNYNVYPMLVVGSESFTNVGFQTSGKNTKFRIITKMPGEQTADRNDPYGETGFSSIRWFHATLVERPERIAVLKTLAPL